LRLAANYLLSTANIGEARFRLMKDLCKALELAQATPDERLQDGALNGYSPLETGVTTP
jgi:hypothetical protein